MADREFTNINGIKVCDQTARDSIPTKTSQLTNDSGYITNIPDEYITETELNAKGYATTSQIPTVPTNVSEFTNDANYASETFVTNKIAEAQLGGGSGTVDLSGYQTKNDDTINGTDKNIVSNINNINSQIKDIVNKTIPSVQGELTANIVNAMNVSNNLLNNKYRIKSYHRDFYIEDGYVKTLQITDLKKLCWFYLLDNNYIKYTINKNTKWALIGFGDNYEEYCIVINLMGLSTRTVYKMDTSNSTSLNINITADACSIGDIIEIYVEGKNIKFIKNGVDWFSIDILSNQALSDNIKNIKLGLASASSNDAFRICDNFMGLKDETVNEIKNVTINVNNKYTQNSSWKDKTFVSLGDSIMWQDGKEYNNTNYPSNKGNVARGIQTLLKEKLEFASYNNIAISDRPMANGTSNGDGTNTTGKTIHYNDYDLVIIGSGTNDFKLNVPLGVLSDIGSSFDTNTFIGAYQDLIEYILTDKPTIRICLFTPLHRNNGGYNSWNYSNKANHKLIDYVNAILELAKLYSIPVCDNYSNSGINKFNLDVYTMDGLHPHDKGYEQISYYDINVINNI